MPQTGSMRKSKVIPQELTSQFRVSKKKLLLEKDNALKMKNSTVEFRTRSLPSLPAPRKELQDLLFEYKLLSDVSFTINSPKKHKMAKQKRNPKPINSFIAFRSFYTREIRNPIHQREISQKLAKLWVNEPNRTIWNEYTESYNNYLAQGKTDLSLVDWLCETLNIDTNGDLSITDDFSIPSYYLTQQFDTLSGTIEDIYLFDQ